MKTIHLKKGDVLVDDQYYDELLKYKLLIKPDEEGYPTVRAVVYPETGKTTVLVCELMFGVLPDDRVWEHFDGNMLNNQRLNLQVTTPERAKKKKRVISRKAHSQWHGVFNGYGGAFTAFISHKHKRIYLGLYADIRSAAIAYNYAALKYHEDKAIFNDIPGWEKITPKRLEGRRNSVEHMCIYPSVSNKFQVQIKKRGVPSYQKTFDTLELAIEARDLHLKS